MATVFLGLGSNLGNREAYLNRAEKELSQLPKTTIVKISNRIETSPVGGPPQGLYVNAVAQVETQLSPLKLLNQLKNIEENMGRPKIQTHWGPRIIDLDLLSYNDLTLDTPELTLPHPRLHERSFVLIPLSEIAPGWKHPIFRLTAKELLTGRGRGDCRARTVLDPFLNIWEGSAELRAAAAPPPSKKNRASYPAH